MGTSSHWPKTPRQSVAEECARRGVTSVVAGCVALLDVRPFDDDLIIALGGPPADWVRTGEPSGPRYWLRVWALRGLLYAWDDSAEPAVLNALGDDAWRVREMALKVVARHRLKAASQQVVELRSDPSTRVGAAAARASRALTGP
jgi:HEAT repeats